MPILQSLCHMEPHNPTLRIYERNLPHWNLDGSIYFITFNTWEKLELNTSAQQIVFDACSSLIISVMSYILLS